MPRFNGAGPLGFGPGTGRGLGPCGAGMGWGRGRRAGFGSNRFGGWGYQQQITEKEEKEILKGEVEYLKDELKAMQKRLTELKN